MKNYLSNLALKNKTTDNNPNGMKNQHNYSSSFSEQRPPKASGRVVSFPKQEGFSEVDVAKRTIRAVNRIVWKLGRVFKGMLILAIVLTTLEHFVPEARTTLHGVYAFSDKIAMPVLNWMFSFVTKVYLWIAELPIVRNLIHGLANLIQAHFPISHAKADGDFIAIDFSADMKLKEIA